MNQNGERTAGTWSAHQPAAWYRWLRIPAVLVLVAVVAGGLLVIQEGKSSRRDVVGVLLNLDASTAGNGLDLARAQVADDAQAAAISGGGVLVVYGASGAEARELVRVDLRVERDGVEETDAAVRRGEIGERISEAFKAAAEAAPSFRSEGRALLPLFQAAERLRPEMGQLYLTYVGFGLGTVDPMDARILVAGDPGQAVADRADRLPQLRGTDLRVIFPAAAGPQAPLNSLTSEWRLKYWQRLAETMGARLTDTAGRPRVDERNILAPPLAGAPTAPAIDNLPDPTLAPTPPLVGTAGPAAVLAGAQFKPDSPEFVDSGRATTALAPLVNAWQANPGKYQRADCVGRTLALGPREGAISLAAQRAEQAGALLRPAMPVTTRGAGFDEPLPDIPPLDPRQRSTICVLIAATK